MKGAWHGCASFFIYCNETDRAVWNAIFEKNKKGNIGRKYTVGIAVQCIYGGHIKRKRGKGTATGGRGGFGRRTGVY